MLNPTIYGSLIAIAIWICLALAEKKAKHYGKDSRLTWDMGLTGLLCGLAGARAYHVVDFWELYSANPALIWQVWHGGLAIWGGIVGAISGIYVYLKLHKTSDTSFWLDLFALYVPLGQAIGRWGNYFNQENFGAPTNLPWKIFIDPQYRPDQYKELAYYHPLFLYESILNLALYFILIKLGKNHPVGKGYIINFYLIGYAVIRFFLEFLRIDSWAINGVNTAQSLSVMLFFVGLGGLIARTKRT